MSRNIFVKVFFIFFALFIIGCSDSESQDNIDSFASVQKDALTLYKETVASQKYIIHALGGDEVDGKKYTYINSVEVLKKWYDKGFRLFEVDIWETSDGELVLSHRDNAGALMASDCARLGLEYPANPSYDEFMACKAYGIYSVSSFKQLVDFMSEGGAKCL